MKQKLMEIGSGIGISVVAIIISIVIIVFQLMNEGSIWLGIVLLLSNITILLSNSSRRNANQRKDIN